MKRLGEADTKELYWTRTLPSLLESVYTLRDGPEDGDVIAIVRWGGEPTVLETDDGRWFLTHRGMWIQRVLIEPEIHSDGTDSFSVRRDWRHRWRFQRADGAGLRWRWAGLASLNWVCEDAVGDLLAYVTVSELNNRPAVHSPLEAKGQVMVAARIAPWPDAAFILSVGWYLLLMARLYSEVSPGG